MECVEQAEGRNSHKRSSLTQSRRENREVHKDHKSMTWLCQLREKVGVAWQSASGQTFKDAKGKGVRNNRGLERSFPQASSSIPQAVFQELLQLKAATGS